MTELYVVCYIGGCDCYHKLKENGKSVCGLVDCITTPYRVGVTTSDQIPRLEEDMGKRPCKRCFPEG